MRMFIVAALFAMRAITAAEEPALSGPTPYPERLQWWAESRFGMFVHWGPVSLKGTEIGWSRGREVPEAEYDALYRSFNPTNFNAREWARIARDTGAKYLVLTTRHHDGFCLWDTRLTEYNIMNTPFGRDVVKELAEACRAENIVFCTYYSINDWWHPDYPLGSPGGKTTKAQPNMDRYNRYIKNQLAELVGNYGPIGLMWFDGEWESPWTLERGQDLFAHCRSLQDSMIINNRVGKGRDGMAGTTRQTAGNPGDYDTPEQRIGKYQVHRPWESCITLCKQWSWKPDDAMKSLKECVHTLLMCAGGDGNLLLNVGPMPDGRVEPRQVERLKELGDWLRKNGESVYGTRGGPYKPTSDLVSTRKGNSIFLHLLNEKQGHREIPDLPCRVKKASLLGGSPVKFQQSGGKLKLDLSQAAIDPIATIVRLDLDGPALSLPDIPLQPEVKASASNVFRKEIDRYGAEFAFDGDSNTRWATDAGTREAWIKAELTEQTVIKGVRIQEALGNRINSFEFQYLDGTHWKTVFTGNQIGPAFSKDFDPVIAREFRILITEASEGPTIAKIELVEQ
jgi:alpha-L-fucosidase